MSPTDHLPNKIPWMYGPLVYRLVEKAYARGVRAGLDSAKAFRDVAIDIPEGTSHDQKRKGKE